VCFLSTAAALFFHHFFLLIFLFLCFFSKLIFESILPHAFGGTILDAVVFHFVFLSFLISFLSFFYHHHYHFISQIIIIRFKSIYILFARKSCSEYYLWRIYLRWKYNHICCFFYLCFIKNYLFHLLRENHSNLETRMMIIMKYQKIYIIIIYTIAMTTTSFFPLFLQFTFSSLFSAVILYFILNYYNYYYFFLLL